MKSTNKIQLIQPRHIYAPPVSESKQGNIYFPSSLISIASILLSKGIEVEFIDENITTDYELSNIVGINLLGAPYIPVVREFEKRLRHKFGDNFRLFIGGQIVNGLTKKDFENLFSDNVINGNENEKLFGFFDKKVTINYENKVSHIPVFEKIPNLYLKLYLKNEICVHLSQGCKFSCTFCSATRTKTINGIKTRVTEQYRDIDLVVNDFEYLIHKALKFNYKSLSVYLSNLDLFQSPLLLHEFAIKVNKLLEKYKFNFNFRGLATVSSFLKMHKTNKDLIVLMKKIGLKQVGYGIDGATAEVYRLNKKPQTAQMCLDAIKLTSEYSITPETLMVFGHNNKEDEESLKKAVEFSKQMYKEYGSLPRPHIAKDIVPGNDGWYDKNNSHVIEAFYDDILLFQNLDFTALPSKFTHENDEFRAMVIKYYSEICNLPSSLTQYVKPLNSKMTKGERNDVNNFNKGKYDL